MHELLNELNIWIGLALLLYILLISSVSIGSDIFAWIINRFFINAIDLPHWEFGCRLNHNTILIHTLVFFMMPPSYVRILKLSRTLEYNTVIYCFSNIIEIENYPPTVLNVFRPTYRIIEKTRDIKNHHHVGIFPFRAKQNIIHISIYCSTSANI